MALPKIIAFTGRKGHGKNTAAEIFKKEINLSPYLVTELAFADTLKHIAADSLGLGYYDIELLKREEHIKVANGLSLRGFLNTLGDALKDNFGYDLWAKSIIEQMDQLKDNINPKYILLTDLRYPVEEEAIKKYADDIGTDLHIIKMVNLNIDTNPNDIEHESETLVDKINPTVIIKAESKKEIEIKIKEFINEHF